MNSINFQWELTEEDFQRMFTDTEETDIFGSVRFGEYLVEFRLTNPGLPDCEHILTTDIYHYGEEGDEEYFLCDNTPYHLLDEEFAVPHRRSLEGFMRAVENEVIERLTTRTWYGFKSEIIPSCATCATLSHETWHPQPKHEGAARNKQEVRVQTRIGTIVVAAKDEGADYPGVWIGLERNGRIFDVAMVEVDQDPADAPDLLKVHVYDTNPHHDDPVYDYATDASAIDRYNNAVHG